MIPDAPEQRAGARRLVRTCAGLQTGERAYVVSDERTRDVADYVASEAKMLTPHVRHDVIPACAMHGSEPPSEVAARMAEADVIFGMTTMSMAHTAARRRAVGCGARYLSLPDYSLDLLASPSLRADFAAIALTCDRLADIIDASAAISES